jgi:hypothetical protein
MEVKLKKSDGKYDMRTAAVCGLFCPSCQAFIGTREDPERLKSMAQAFDMPVEDLKCEGCRTEVRSFYCRKICVMRECAAQKGVEFCGSCPDYPCPQLQQFQAAAPHRIELWSSLERIREVGPEKWYGEMLDRYACPRCGTINSAYILRCKECGADPSCAYVADHKDEIAQARPMSILKKL